MSFSFMSVKNRGSTNFELGNRRKSYHGPVELRAVRVVKPRHHARRDPPVVLSSQSRIFELTVFSACMRNSVYVWGVACGG
jgi:hypothetical protein